MEDYKLSPLIKARRAQFGSGLKEAYEAALNGWKSGESSPLAHIHQAEKTMDWQPIETAPKDGRAILGAWAPDAREIYEISTIRAEPDGKWSFLMSDAKHTYFEEWENAPPTHWMPLPAPPADGGSDA